MSARLLIDVGNTRLKWTVAADDGGLAPVQALAHGGDPAALVEWLPLPDGLHDAWIANVTGDAPGERLAAALSVRHHLRTRFARPVDGLASLSSLTRKSRGSASIAGWPCWRSGRAKMLRPALPAPARR